VRIARMTPRMPIEARADGGGAMADCSDDTSRGLRPSRRPSPGQLYYRRKRAEGKSPKEALRCLRRRLSDAVYRCLLADQRDLQSGAGTTA
jgi:hypothetical protein